MAERDGWLVSMHVNAPVVVLNILVQVSMWKFTNQNGQTLDNSGSSGLVTLTLFKDGEVTLPRLGLLWTGAPSPLALHFGTLTQGILSPGHRSQPSGPNPGSPSYFLCDFGKSAILPHHLLQFPLV